MGSYSRAKYVTQSTDFPRSADSKSVSASYATFADLPASSTTIGNTAFVVATNKLYIWSGVGWYLVAEVTNASPSAISGVDGAYSLAIDGTATTITAVSTDPEGFALTWSYAVTSGSLAVTPAASAIAVVNNGASAYTLSGGATGDNSNVDIVVGQTVNFTVNASGHPFYIRDSDGGANVSSPAATGQGATSGVVSWTPNTAGTYYYQCGNHAAMVGTITVGAATVSATVAQADNVFTITPSTNTAAANTFSLTFNVTDGLNGSVSAVSAFTLQFSVTNSRYTALLLKATTTGLQTFDDASTSNHTITAGGNVTASTFSPHRHGGYSLHGDGTGDYLQMPHSTDTNLTGDFTIECWVYLNSGKEQGFVSKWTVGSYGWTLYTTTTNVTFLSGNGSSPGFPIQLTSSALALKQWHHLAVSRTGFTISTYLNGTRTNTSTDTNNCSTSTPVVIGSVGQNFSTDSIDGYMRDVRIVNGTGLYTGTSFAVPTEPLTAITNTKFLLGNLPYLKDQSTSNHTITVVGNASLKPFSLFDNGPYSEASHGASAYFDGSGDYITAADHEDFNMGSENFTAECWIYPTASPSQPIIMGQWSGSYSWALETSNNSSRHLRFLTNAGGIVDNVSSTAVPLNQWSHVALVRNGTSFVAYLNGTSVVSSTVTGALANSTDALSIGASASGSYAFQGHISNVRLVKGTSVYTSNFTPPTAPLTAVTNTKFLLNPEPAIIDLAQKFHIDGLGLTGPEGSTTQVAIAGTKSIMHTDASTAYGVYIQGYSPEFRLNSTFTLEFWAYLQMFNQDTHFYETYGGTNNSFDNATGTETRIGIIGSQLTHRNNFGSNAIGNYFKQNTDYSNIVYHAANYGITFDNAQWHHWAITQDDSGNCKWYLDGTQIWSYTISLPIAITNTSNYRMRSTAWGNNSSPGPAYIQDYRLTRGLIRYTSNFTPPTAELQG